MVDLTVTPASVLPVKTGINPTRMKTVTFGATIVAGNTVYLDKTVGKWKIADGNVSAQLAGADGFGIALCGGGDGQPGIVGTGGDIFLAAGMVLGGTYVQSDNAGKIAPVADQIATDWVTVLGVAVDANTLRMPAGGALAAPVQHG